MRPSSVYSTRASHASSLTSQAANAQQTAKLLEKMKEFDALQALEQASASYVRRIEALSKDCEVMADAGKVHGDVLAQWPEMFRILSLYDQMRSQTQDDGAQTESAEQQVNERLVRIPIEELQEQSATSTS